jgi:hypothetical protein
MEELEDRGSRGLTDLPVKTGIEDEGRIRNRQPIHRARADPQVVPRRSAFDEGREASGKQ